MPAVFLVTLILVFAIVFIAKGVISDKLDDESRQKIELAICGDIEGSYLGIGVMALQHMDSSRFAIDFHTMEAEEAREALVNGEIMNYLEIPDNFLDSVVSGENLKVRFYFSNSQMGIGNKLTSEMADAISEYIILSQNAIYGMQNLCDEYGYDDVYWDATEELNMRYIDIILTRQDFFEVEELGLSNDLSMTAYYTCGFTVLFFLIFGMNGCAIFIRRDTSLGRMLSVGGVGATAQTVVEFMSYLILVIVNLLGMFCLLGRMCEFFEFTIPEWENIGLSEVLLFGVVLLPAVIMISAMAFMCYELSGNVVSGMLLQFLVALSMAYVSGCFYPASFFPESVQVIGRILPSGVAMRYASLCMRSETDSLVLIGIAGYTAVFVIITVLLRKKRLEQK